jgi:hypothetical protein
MNRFALFAALVALFMAGCDAKPAPQAAPAKAVAQPQPPGEVVREQAKVGMTGKGEGYGGDPITEPVRQMWRVKEQVVLLQIDQALKLFEATESRKPKSHEEFMEKIIKENNIPLPVLPAGHRYVYDPAKAELMVERPK